MDLRSKDSPTGLPWKPSDVTTIAQTVGVGCGTTTLLLVSNARQPLQQAASASQ